MNKKILSLIVASTLAVNVAHADSDDALWAVGGFILGTIVSDKNKEERHQPPPPPQYPPEQAPLPPPYKQSRLVPIFKTVCEYEQEYDVWGNPTRRVRTCHQEIAGYREVND